MNAQTAHTPRTDAQTQTVFTDAGTINAVPQDFARTLERENALLVEHNERMRAELDKIANFDWSAAATQRDASDTMQRIARAALNPPPTK